MRMLCVEQGGLRRSGVSWDESCSSSMSRLAAVPVGQCVHPPPMCTQTRSPALYEDMAAATGTAAVLLLLQ
jgi:hypothetical protein